MELTIEFLLVFLWALAEATVWPFMPDALIAPLVAVDPQQWWRVVVPAVCGTVSGGMISYFLGRRYSAKLVLRMPFVRAPMLAQCREWLASEGPRGVRHQALSMLPFKVFCMVAGETKMPLFPFFLWAIFVRGTRFLVVALLASIFGNLFPALLRDHLAAAVLVWAVLFGFGLFFMARSWARRTD